jgi:hypothetical protein
MSIDLFRIEVVVQQWNAIVHMFLTENSGGRLQGGIFVIRVSGEQTISSGLILTEKSSSLRVYCVKSKWLKFTVLTKALLWVQATRAS